MIWQCVNYELFSHDELFNMIMAGDPQSLRTTADSWSSTAKVLEDLEGDLNRDLQSLAGFWHGGAADMFHLRVSSISAFCGTLAGEVSHTGTQVREAAAALETGQKDMPDPDDTDDNDSTTVAAVVGTVAVGPAGGVLGSVLGHQRDDQQRKDAKATAVRVLDTAAGAYQVSGAALADPAQPPKMLSIDVRTDGLELTGSTGGAPVSGPGGRPGSFTPRSGGTADTWGTGAGPSVQAAVDPALDPAGGPGNGTGGSAAGAQLGGSNSGPVLAGGSPPVATAPGSGVSGSPLGITPGNGGSPIPPSGSAGPVAGGPGAGPAGPGVQPGAARQTRTGAALNTESGTARHAQPGVGASPATSSAGGTTGAGQPHGPLAGTRGQPGEDDYDEYDTWLVEDDAPFIAAGPATPPVIAVDDRDR